MALELSHLAVFDAVACERSISRGADRLMVSQPAVSKQIRQLERSAGTPLFDRLPRGVALTAAGELLAGYARKIFALQAEAAGAMDDLQGLARGTLSVAAGTTVGVYVLPALFVKYRKAHPNIGMHMEVAGSEVIGRRLIDGAIDVGLTEGVVAGDAFDSIRWFVEELVAIAPPGHRMTRGRAMRARALCSEPFVVRETGSETKSFVERTLAGKGLVVSPAMALGSTEAIKHAVAAGVGVAIVPRLAVEAELAIGRLGLVRLSDITFSRPVFRVTLKDRHRSAVLTAFLALLEQNVPGKSGK